SFRYGIADTPLLARALARFAADPVAEAGKGAEALAPLPMAALRLDEEALGTLRALALRRVGQLMDKPRGGLARRIGPAALDRRDEARGARASALLHRLEVSPWMTETRLAEPVAAEDQVLRLAQDLARRLCERMEGEGVGGRRFVLELFRLDGAVK